MSDDFSSNENFGLLVTSMEYILVYQKMLQNNFIINKMHSGTLREVFIVL